MLEIGKDRITVSMSDKCFAGLFLCLFFAFVFLPHIIGLSFIGWDTHDVGFVNFLYFSDSLCNGIFPMWNPFILGGVPFFDLFNIASFNPIVFPFSLLAYVLNPLVAFEWYVLTTVIISAIGVYTVLRNDRHTIDVSIFGTILFVLVLFPSILGQSCILFSISSVPWVVYLCRKISTNRIDLKYINITAFISFIMLNGYLWLNVVILLGGFVYLLICSVRHRQLRKVIIINIGISFFCVFFCYIICLIPGYLNIMSNYKGLGAGYISPDPRLRSVAVIEPHPSYIDFLHENILVTIKNIFLYIVSMIDNRIGLKEYSFWSDGLGVVLFTLFILVLSRRNIIKKNRVWFVVFIIAIAYSLGIIWPFVRIVPVLNSNRWIRLGNYFVIISAFFIVFRSLWGRRWVWGKSWQIVLSLTCYIFLIVYSLLQGKLLIVIPELIVGLVFFVFVRHKSLLQTSRFLAFGVLTLLVLFRAGWIIYSNHFNNHSRQEYHSFLEHKTNPIYENNIRLLCNSLEYDYKDVRWLLQKTPISHGYSNQSNPLYWYVKDKSFMGKIAYISYNMKYDGDLKNGPLIKSNKDVERLMKKIDDSGHTVLVDNINYVSLKDNETNTIKAVRIEPNKVSIQVESGSQCYLIVNNQWNSSWRAFVDGERRDLFKANILFQGIHIEQGDHLVELRYFSPFSLILFLPFFITIILSLVNIYTRRESISTFIDSRRKR